MKLYVLRTTKTAILGSYFNDKMLYSENLVAQAQQGDKQAFNQLANAWYPRIYNFAYKYFADEELAMEVTQKTFISVYQHFESLQDTEKFKPWIYRIAHNMCHNEHKKTKKTAFLGLFKTNKENDDEMEYLPISDEQNRSNPSNYVENIENTALLEKALAKINPDQKAVVIMKEYEGLKFSEIAEILQISESTAKARLYYGLDALRKVFEGWNLSKEQMLYS